MHLLPMAKALLFTAALAGAACAQAATMFSAKIDAAQIVGGSTATGTGWATASLVGGPGTYSFRYVAEFTGFDFGTNFLGSSTTPDTADDALNFHIHIGAPGFTGPVTYSVRQPDRENGSEPLVELLPGGVARITGSWDIADGNTAVAAAGTNTGVGSLETFWAPVMLAAQPGEAIGLYFDIHTVAFPNSAIRGQITAVSEPTSAWAGLAALLALASVRRQRRG